MLQYPQIDPIAIAIGPLQIHWYGLMYVIGLVAAWWLGRRRAHRLGLSHDDIGDLIFYAAGGSTSGSKYHVALYIGGNRMIESPSPGKTVRDWPVYTYDLVPYVARPTG